MAGPKGSKYYDVFLDYSIVLRERNTNQSILTQEQLCLLLNIDELESIAASAKKMDISYRKAWELVRRAEEELGFPLVSKSRVAAMAANRSLLPMANNWLMHTANSATSLTNPLSAWLKTFFKPLIGELCEIC